MNDKLRKILADKEKVLLIIILLFSAFLRLYQLGNAPLWIDESTSAIASMKILEKGIPVFDSGAYYSRALIQHYTQALFLIISKSDYAVRIPSVIFGLLTIILAYKIGKEYSKSGGIIAALFTGIFYLEVFYSRQARFYQLFQLLFYYSIYALYKSKDNKYWLYTAIITLIITINTQVAGLVLTPIFIIHILHYQKKLHKLWAIIPGILLIQKLLPAKGLASNSTTTAVNLATKYLGFTNNMHYLIILAVIGMLWAFMKNKNLTTMIILPSIILLIGVLDLQVFALRYAYFITLPIILYSSILLSILYEKYGRIMIIAILLVIIIPSNLVYPQTYINVITPINYNINDYTAPEIILKDIPTTIINELRNNTMITFFSSTAEWYIKKPEYVLPFSMDGRGTDQISYNNSEGIRVDVYSGAPIINYEELKTLKKPYYIITDYYSTTKLKPEQKTLLEEAINNCSQTTNNKKVTIIKCS